MKRKKLFVFSLCAVAALVFSATASAQVSATYQQIATIPLPGGLTSYDISWIDQGSQKFYLADRTSTAGTGRIDVIDTQTNKLLYTIPTTAAELGFVGNVGPGKSGPNGVVAIPQLNQLYVGDGNSTVKVVDLAAKAIIAIIPTGGTLRADELAYDPLDHIIMITNPNDSPPFLTFISAATLTVLGRITYPSYQIGLEQPVWDGQTGRFLISVPSTATSGGEVDAIDPIAMQITNHFSVSCSPAGLALGPIQRLMTSCGIALDARVGRTLAGVNGVTGDEIWFNPGDNRYYFGSTNVSVVDAETHQFLGYVTTNGGHTLAVDSSNNHVFVPTPGAAGVGGVTVFSATGK